MFDLFDDLVDGLFPILFIVAVVGGIGVLVILPLFLPLFTQNEITITVEEKVPYHDGQYLIISEGGEVFSVTDEPILLLFDASDRYASLKEGKTYEVKVCGVRFHLLSWYRNIIEIREVAP